MTPRTPGPGVVEVDHADPDVALFKDTIFGEQTFQVVEDSRWITKGRKCRRGA